MRTCNICGGTIISSVYVGDVLCPCHCTVKNYNITPSPRIDWCGACKKEHGYNCPKDTPHTHGKNGSHTETYANWSEKHGEPVKILQFICLDDGVIYKEIEITREVK